MIVMELRQNHKTEKKHREEDVVGNMEIVAKSLSKFEPVLRKEFIIKFETGLFC